MNDKIAVPQSELPGTELDTSLLPPDFLWGVSTSSYQIEGAAHEDGRGLSIWDVFCHQKGRIANGDTGDIACDHYHRYAEDIALMREMGVRAYRFSTAWPRLLPRGRGAVNEQGLAFYDRLIDGLLEARIEPWLCLYHWDLPQSLDDLGGWTNRDIAGWFADYAALVARRYGDRVKHFATFNEPSVSTLFGYALGWNAPGIADKSSYCKAAHHLNLAHGAAVDAIRDLLPSALIGAIHNRQPVLPESGKPEDARAAELLDAHWNLLFPEPQSFAAYPALIAHEIEPYQQAGDMAHICRRLDWFGVNHYSPIYARADASSQLGFAWGKPPASAQQTGVGWSIHPDAFRDVLIAASRRYGLPIHVTENGSGGIDAPDATGAIVDKARIDYLRAYTNAMGEAIRAGADIRGYFVWSLLDNFEWGAGFTNRFGLVHVDFKTLKRTPKASAHWYAGLIRKTRKD